MCICVYVYVSPYVHVYVCIHVCEYVSFGLSILVVIIKVRSAITRSSVDRVSYIICSSL